MNVPPSEKKKTRNPCQRSVTIFIMWMGICLFAATTKFNCAVNNMKCLPKIHYVGKQNAAVGYQRKGNRNEREKESWAKILQKGAINPARLLKLVLFLFQLAKSIVHTRQDENQTAFKNYCGLKTEKQTNFWCPASSFS